MKLLWALVLLLVSLWVLSIFFLWPLPLVLALFAAVVSLSSMSIWLAFMARRARRT
jgi:heme A synthase